MDRPPPIPATVEIPQGRIHDIDLPSFRIGRTPVTNGEYAPFLEEGRTPPPWWTDPAFASPGQPVVGVSWDDASAYCDWLSRVAGGMWRLPSEAEWERAISGGATLPLATAWGSAIPAGEIPEGPLSAPWEAGRGTPNAFGVHDPGTVVHEWCLDWREAADGFRGAAESPSARRASRGGSWRHRVPWSPPSARSSLPPHFRYSDYGFRVVLEVRRT